MVSLEQYKEKLLNIFDNIFYSKTEIELKENVINEIIDNKANIDDNFSGDYNDLYNKPFLPSITVTDDYNEIIDDGIYLYIVERDD